MVQASPSPPPLPLLGAVRCHLLGIWRRKPAGEGHLRMDSLCYPFDILHFGKWQLWWPRNRLKSVTGLGSAGSAGSRWTGPDSAVRPWRPQPCDNRQRSPHNARLIMNITRIKCCAAVSPLPPVYKIIAATRAAVILRPGKPAAPCWRWREGCQSPGVDRLPSMDHTHSVCTNSLSTMYLLSKGSLDERCTFHVCLELYPKRILYHP